MTRARDAADQINRVNSSAADATAITISASENVGIGTSSPSEKLEVSRTDSDNAIARFSTNNATADIFLESSEGQIRLRKPSGAEFAILNNSNTERMRIDANGTVTMPYQPAFSVKPAGAQNNIAVNAQVQIIWGTETFDVGGNFASNVFTAPVSGKYQFNVVVGVENLDSAAIYAETVLITSNTSIYTTIDPDFGQDNAFWSFTTPVLCDMDAGDTASVAIVQGGGTAQMDVRIYSHFSGFLAC